LWGLINNETRWFSFKCVIKALPFKELIISPNLHIFVQNIREDNVIGKKITSGILSFTMEIITTNI
jgi:hypothetical protein